MQLPRTYLFVPGDRPERFAKALACGADAVILDLEDAVAPRAQGRGPRRGRRSWLAAAAPTSARASWCASTTTRTPWFDDDLALLGRAASPGVMLPKAETRRHAGRACGGAAPACAGAGAGRDARAACSTPRPLAAADGVQRLAFGTHRLRARPRPVRRRTRGLDLRRQRGWRSASRGAGIAAPVAGVTPGHRRRGAAAAPTWRAPAPTASAPSCASIRSQVARRSTPRCGPRADELDWARRVLAAGEARRAAPCRSTAAWSTARAAARRSAMLARAGCRALTPDDHFQGHPPWPPPSSTPPSSATSSAPTRCATCGRTRTAPQKYLDIEAALAMVQGRLGHHPAGGGRRDRQRTATSTRSTWSKLRAADRAHRLPDPRRRLAAQRAVPRQAGRVLPLGRDDAGHHRHRHGAADPRGARHSSTPTSRRSRAALADLARKHRDTPMIGRSNLQQAIPVTFGYKMAGAPRRRSSAIASASAQLQPRVLVGEFGGACGHAGVAREGRDGNAGRPDARSWAWASR